MNSKVNSTVNSKFLSLKTENSIFANTNVKRNVNANSSTETPTWSWGSAVLWLIFAIGIVMIIGGLVVSVTDSNIVATNNETNQKNKARNKLIFAMAIIGFFLCILPFIISAFTGTRMT